MVICLGSLNVFANIIDCSTETNSLDPDQTVPVGSGSTLFVEEASQNQQTTHSDDFCCDWRFEG